MNKEVNRQSSEDAKAKSAKDMRHMIVHTFRHQHPDEKHVSAAAAKINKKIDSHFNGADKGRSMKSMPEEKQTLSTIKEVIEKRERGLALAHKKMYKEETELEEAKQNVFKTAHTWGTTTKVYHNDDHSSHYYILHPEHSAAVSKLNDGEHTKFTDETGNKVTAHRKGNEIHFTGSKLRTGSAVTIADRKYFSEEVEQIDELSPATYSSYIKKASNDVALSGLDAGRNSASTEYYKVAKKKMSNRLKFIAKATDKLAKEELDLDEGNKENKEKKNSYVSSIIQNKLHPSVLPSIKYGRAQLKKEELELDEANMPIGIAIKKRITSQLSDAEFARKHAGKTISQLQKLAKLHGLPINHYVNRRNAGRSTAGKNMKIEGVEHVDEGLGKTLAAGALAIGMGAGGAAAVTKAYPDKPATYQVIGKNVVTKKNPGNIVHTAKSKEDAMKWATTQKEELELDEAKRGRPRKNGSKPAHDDEGGREHIIVQLRKAENLRGNRKIEFNDGEKHQLPLSHVKKALDMHLKMKPIQKGEYEVHIAKSHKHFNDVVVKGKPVEVAGKKGVTLAKSVKEDYSTVRAAARGPEIPVTVVNPSTGKLEVIKRRMPRKEIKIEARDQFAKQYLSPEEAEEKKEGQGSPKGASADMTADSRNKLKTDPLFSKVKLNLPPTVGNKAAGGEDTVYGLGKYSVAEEKTLNSLYEDLSEENKEFFNDLMQTKEGIEKLLQFARGQGY